MIRCADHIGNEYDSICEMCTHYGIGLTTYYKRIKSGWELEAALTTPTKARLRCVDHKGNKYGSIAELCGAYNIISDDFYRRKYLGWSLEEILEIPLGERVQGSVESFDGKVFQSIAAMCRFYRVSRTMYYKRIKAGWTQKEALLTPSTQKSRRCSP